MAKWVALLGLACALMGCSGGEESKPEPQASKEAASQAASTWTPEQIAAFKKAHDEARSGADGGK